MRYGGILDGGSSWLSIRMVSMKGGRRGREKGLGGVGRNVRRSGERYFEDTVQLENLEGELAKSVLSNDAE